MQKAKHQPQHWTFLGFGEAAAAFYSVALQSQAVEQVSVCLPFERAPSQATRKRLAELALEATNDPKTVRYATIVLSLVSPAIALQTAQRVAPYLCPGCLYVDLNSIAGPTAIEIHGLVTQSETRFVDAAVMGPIPLMGVNVPIMLSGTAAPDFHSLVTPLGFNTSVISDRPGDASALKMLWSVITKGTIALFAEALLAAQRLELVAPLLTLLSEQYGTTGSDAMVLRLLRSSTRSGERRLEEMNAAKKTLQSASVPAWTVEATLQWLHELAPMEAARDAPDVETVLREISNTLDA